MGRDFPPVQAGPEVHPASCSMGTGSFPGIKFGRGVLLTPHLLLVPWSWKSRAKPLPTLWSTTGPVTGTLCLYLFTCYCVHVRTGLIAVLLYYKFELWKCRRTISGWASAVMTRIPCSFPQCVQANDRTLP